MVSTNLSPKPSPPPTILAHTTTLKAESECDEYPTDREPNVSEEVPKDLGPRFSAISAHSFSSPDSNVITWDSPDDPDNPKNWSYCYKWFVTLICSLLTLNVTFASSAPSSASLVIAKELESPPETSYLITTMFLVGYTFGPMFWGPGSEIIGRRPILVFSLSVYTLFHLGQVLTRNMTTIIITRFFGGFFASAPLTTSGGVIADIWDPVNRGLAASVFAMNVFLGPVLGPVIGSYVTFSHLGWRWVFWIMMIFAGSCTVFGILFLPETYAPVLLAKKANRLRTLDPEKNKSLHVESEAIEWGVRGLLHRTLLRPLEILLMEPILLFITIYISVVYGIIYAMFEAFPVIFIRVHNLTVPHDGLLFIGVGIGSTIAALINIWFLRMYPRLMVEWRGFPPPEMRLYSGMVGGPLLVISILWLGWTGNYQSIPWYVPALSTIPLGLSIALVFMSCLSYIIDTYLMYSASALAANMMVRSAVGALFPLFTDRMFEEMGVNWASTLIGGIAFFLAPMPFVFFKYGPWIRQKSKFAPCVDLKIAKQLDAEHRAAQV